MISRLKVANGFASLKTVTAFSWPSIMFNVTMPATTHCTPVRPAPAKPLAKISNLSSKIDRPAMIHQYSSVVSAINRSKLAHVPVCWSNCAVRPTLRSLGSEMIIASAKRIVCVVCTRAVSIASKLVPFNWKTVANGCAWPKIWADETHVWLC